MNSLYLKFYRFLPLKPPQKKLLYFLSTATEINYFLIAISNYLLFVQKNLLQDIFKQVWSNGVLEYCKNDLNIFVVKKTLLQHSISN